MRLLPAARSGSWWLWLLTYGVILSLLLCLNRFVVLGQSINLTMTLRFSALAFVLAALVNTLGWLGARWIWLLTTFGILAGVVMMFVYGARDLTGWQDLISFLAFGQGVVFGFGLGVLVEIFYFMMMKRRRGKRPNI